MQLESHKQEKYTRDNILFCALLNKLNQNLVKQLDS